MNKKKECCFIGKKSCFLLAIRTPTRGVYCNKNKKKSPKTIAEIKKSRTFVPLLGCGVMVTQQILVLLFMVRVRATQLKAVKLTAFFVCLLTDLPIGQN